MACLREFKEASVISEVSSVVGTVVTPVAGFVFCVVSKVLSVGLAG
jgi:hypothetical protein